MNNFFERKEKGNYKYLFFFVFVNNLFCLSALENTAFALLFFFLFTG